MASESSAKPRRKAPLVVAGLVVVAVAAGLMVRTRTSVAPPPSPSPPPSVAAPILSAAPKPVGLTSPDGVQPKMVETKPESERATTPPVPETPAATPPAPAEIHVVQ